MRRRTVSITLYAVFSAIFIVSSVIATSTYSDVVRAQRDVKLTGADMSAQVLADGSLQITFSISVHNPSAYTLQIQSVSWFVFLSNGTAGPNQLTTLSSYYIGPTQGYTVSKKSDRQFTFLGTVSDHATISKIKAFVNYSTSQGHAYTIESVPYDHDFSITVTIGEYKHDYMDEIYLDNLVTISLSYSSGVTS